MEENIVRSGKFVRNIGIITTVIFLMASIGFAMADNIVISIGFFPLIGLGIVLVLAYEKEKIIVEYDKLTVCRLFKKPQEIRYGNIRCLLSVPLRDRTKRILVDREYHRLLTLEDTFVNLEILYNALKRNNISIVNFGKMVEDRKDVVQYFNVLNIIERNYYNTLVDKNNTAGELSKKEKSFDITKAKIKLKIVGWILILADVATYFIGGKALFYVPTIILLVVYAIYIRYYPYIYVENEEKKGNENTLQLPMIGALMAVLLCIIPSDLFDYDFGDYMKITFILTAILAVPFIIKSLAIEGFDKWLRKLTVVLAVLVISFSIAFPLNFILTFNKPSHESVVITDKDVDTDSSGTDYSLYINWRGEEREFGVSSSKYEETSVGDLRELCIRESVLGLEYYTIH